MLKFSRGLSSEIINEIFQFGEEITNEIRQRSQFNISSVHSFFSGTETFKLVASKTWALVPNQMKLRV